MKPKRLALWLALGAMAGLATGCVWLRLLSFKNQLANLDRYTRVDDRNGLTVHFLKPVLYGDDLFMFLSTRPSTRTTNQNRQTWSWTYNKLFPSTNAEPGDFDLTFEALIQDSKLEGFRLPERVLTVMPRQMSLGFLRSLGGADVNRKGRALTFKPDDIDQKTGSLTFKWGSGSKEKFNALTKAQVAGLLGSPYASTLESNRAWSSLYKYQFAGSPPTPAWARFTFSTNSEKLVFSEGGLGNVGWTLTALPEDTGMRVRLFFVSPTQASPAVQLDPGLAEEYVGRYRDATGHVLTIGQDGGRFAVDGGLSRAEVAKRGWWLIYPQSPTNFYGRDLRFTFLRGPEGRITGLLMGEHGFDAPYTKISDRGPGLPKVVHVATRTLESYTGRYQASWSGQVYTVTRDGGQLLWNGIRIYPASETDFGFKLVDSPLTFVRNDRGEVTGFVLHHSGRDLRAEKLK